MAIFVYSLHKYYMFYINKLKSNLDGKNSFLYISCFNGMIQNSCGMSVLS